MSAPLTHGDLPAHSPFDDGVCEWEPAAAVTLRLVSVMNGGACAGAGMQLQSRQWLQRPGAAGDISISLALWCTCSGYLVRNEGKPKG